MINMIEIIALANILLWTKNENKEGKRSNGDYFGGEGLIFA